MERDTSYSPDVEISEKGRLVFVRDVQPGEVIAIPLHMLKFLRPAQAPESSQSTRHVKRQSQ